MLAADIRACSRPASAAKVDSTSRRARLSDVELEL